MWKGKEIRVGIIGGTGPAGQALATRLAANGATVVLGSRSPEHAEELAAALRASWPDRSLRLTGDSNEVAGACDIVVLATPWDAVASTVRELQDVLAGQVVVSMINALTHAGREFQALVPARGSVAATVQALLPDSFVSAAFQHLPAGNLAALDDEIVGDVLICADTEHAQVTTAELVSIVPGLRAVAAGSLASANAVEALTAVLLNVNIRYKTHVALQLSGLEGRMS